MGRLPHQRGQNGYHRLLQQKGQQGKRDLFPQPITVHVQSHNGELQD